MIRRLLLGVITVVMAVSVAVAGPLEDGVAAYDQGDYANAARSFHLAADQGRATAQFNLGLMYDKGRGVRQDHTEAARWYRMAADQGLASALFNLGSMYDKGEGVPQDLVLAHMWYNLAASNGHHDGRRNRDDIVREMTPDQIAEAQRLAREWKPK